jgi:signal transduction histidine kinase
MSALPMKRCYYFVFIIVSLIFIGAHLFAPVHAQEEKSTILTAERINETIQIDGFANEASWSKARELGVLVKDGSIGIVEVDLRALYDEDYIYFLTTWLDPTESITKNQWKFNGSDWEASENEDRLAFVWNIDLSIEAFEIAGCGILCHGDRMHTNAPDERGDLWQWKASRSNPIGIVDDGFIDDTIIEGYTHEAEEAALHHDEGDEIYIENINGDGNGPMYIETSPEDLKDAQFLFEDEIKNGEARVIDQSDFQLGATVPGYVLLKPTGSRGDIEARGVWREGRWKVEFKRKLKTGHEDDVHFDTTKTYRFGMAIMDNTGGFEKYGTGHSFLLGARTLEFGGKGSKEVVELALIRDYLVSAKAYVNRGESGLALSTISDALTIFNRIRDPVADIDPDLFIKIRNGFVDSRRNPSLDNINQLTENVDLAILTLQGKRKPIEATLALKVLVLWGKIQVYVLISLALLVTLPIYRMLKILKRQEFRYLSIFMLMLITPIFLEGAGRLGALLNIPFLENFSFTTSEFVTLGWAVGMFIALYVGKIGFNEIDNTLKSLEYHSKELEKKMRELKRSQEQLLKSERLASIGQLAASMAHELRNPLGVIKNVSYYLNMALGKSDEKIKKHLGILDIELAASDKIITDLLDFSRGKPPVLEKSDLNSIINTAISRLDLPENIEMETKLGKNLPPLMADKEQLERVFFNIILNAVQAMPKGGELKIITWHSPQYLDSANSKQVDESIVVNVSDTGVGITEEERAMIFEPLFTTKAKGIGLGLVLSKQILEMHRGSIDVQSKVGKGTTFIVRLPVIKGGKKP